MSRLLALLLLVCASLTACSTHNLTGKADASLSARGIPRPGFHGSLLPSGTLQITPKYGVTYVDMILIAGVTALVYQVVDPAASAWEIIETRLPDRRVQYSLRMQRVHNGGEGEARQILERRVMELMREEGMTGYQIQRYTESIDSRLFLPQRTAEAEVLMQLAEPAKIVTEQRPPYARPELGAPLPVLPSLPAVGG